MLLELESAAGGLSDAVQAAAASSSRAVLAAQTDAVSSSSRAVEGGVGDGGDGGVDGQQLSSPMAQSLHERIQRLQSKLAIPPTDPRPT